jgi:hypothetical protein
MGTVQEEIAAIQTEPVRNFSAISWNQVPMFLVFINPVQNMGSQKCLPSSTSSSRDKIRQRMIVVEC